MEKVNLRPNDIEEQNNIKKQRVEEEKVSKEQIKTHFELVKKSRKSKPE